MQKQKRGLELFTKMAIMTLSLWSNCALADGGFVGNGGDVVVCRDSGHKVISVELLDLYEGRVHYQLDSKLENDVSLEILLNELYERTAFADLRIPGNGSDKLKEFISQTNFLKHTQLVDVSDSAHLALPNGCQIEQIVIQMNPIYLHQKRYTVSQDLWDLLDNRNRAALVFHEVIYKYKIIQSQEAAFTINSRDVRYFVAVTVANEISSAFQNQEKYYNFLRWDLWIDDILQAGH